jgi:hypothetical protein
VGEDGGRAYLFHSAWRPDWFVQYIRVESGTPTGLGDEQAMLSILRA